MNRKLNTSSGSQFENNKMDWIGSRIPLGVFSSKKYNGMNIELNTSGCNQFEDDKMDWIGNWVLLGVVNSKTIK